jgi:TetR/AcrR family transcriptional repressor of mexJK operon
MRALPDLSGDTRQRLLEAASAAFCEEGYQVSIERIAVRARVARQTLYNHFASKEVLLSRWKATGTCAQPCWHSLRPIEAKC